MRFIELRSGYAKYATVSDEDYDRVSQYPWYLDGSGYAQSYHYAGCSMHQFVLDPYDGYVEDGYQVHHINRNRLDNRRENLELVTRAQNCLERGLRSDNTSGAKNIYLVTLKSGETRYKFYKQGYSKKQFPTLEEAVQHRDSVLPYTVQE